VGAPEIGLVAISRGLFLFPEDAMFDALSAWLFEIMVRLVPLAHHDYYATRTATEAHYREMAEAVAAFVLETEYKPIFDGADGRARTALWLVTIPASETNYNTVIDNGGSVRKNDNDKGEAVGPWQTHWRGNPWKWTRDDLASDRTKQLMLADMRVRESVNACKRSPMSTWMTGYATGMFDCRENKKGALHVARAVNMWKRHPFIGVVPDVEM
jgi:hypothetical protein